MSPFSVGDVAAAGIGVDVAGALTLARGLFLSSDQIARRLQMGQNTFAAARVAEAESHADAVVGGAALFVGLLIQAVAYALIAGGAPASSESGGAADIAIICTLLGGIAVWVVSAWDRPRRRNRFLVNLAHYDGWGARHSAPNLAELVRYAQVLGYVQTQAELEGVEGARVFVRRVFGVERTRVPWEVGSDSSS